jgi:hypothetical protein
MPHWPEPRQIARSKCATIELLPSVILLRAMEKICQKLVNTGQKGSTPRSERFAHQSRAYGHSIVVSSSLLRCSFLQLEVSQKCSQLIHMRSAAALASGLESRNQLRNRQEKNQLYFQLQPQNFLD